MSDKISGFFHNTFIFTPFEIQHDKLTPINLSLLTRRIKSDNIHFLKPETRKTRIKFCLHNLYISLENVLTPLQFEKGSNKYKDAFR